MATLSPSKARTTLGCGPTPVGHRQQSPHRAALTPRSVLSESGVPNSSHASPHTTSTSAMQALHALNSSDAREEMLRSAAGDLAQHAQHVVASTTSTSAQTCDSDAEGSSEASIDIITEREHMQYSDVKSASPRKPLPAQWLPATALSTFSIVQRVETHEDTKTLASGFPVERKPIQLSRVPVDPSTAHLDGASFLTKEALDAVDANLAPSTLRRSPSKIQSSPVKAPWNSPAASPKVGNLRRSAGSPTKPSPPRTKHLNTHVAADHKRAPSSVASTGATSFHTAHGSPVRSVALSQTSFSSTEDYTDDVNYESPNSMANIELEQMESLDGKFKVSPARAGTILRTRASRPELSINIPSSNAMFDTEQLSASTLASVSSTEVGTGKGLSPISPSRSSRIPRMSLSKGSSARAPTLSSTLKQTKSTQTLRSPKPAKRIDELDHSIAPKTSEARLLRQVRTLDSSGATPILLDRKIRDYSVPASVADVATTVATSHLQDTTLGPRQAHQPTHSSSMLSRATSTSTIRAPRAVDDPASADSAVIYSRKKPFDMGISNSSDADDEYDDSPVSVPGSGDGKQNTSAVRDRSAEYRPSICRATGGERSMKSSMASDLRATATEFVPGSRDVGDGTTGQPAPATELPDMYALDGYGIPWFYHMYPVPVLCPPVWSNGRSKSPRKFRHKKQRSLVSSPIENRSAQDEILPSIETQTTAGPSEGAHVVQSVAESNAMPEAVATTYVKPSNGPFATQFDMVARQTALQDSTNITRRIPEVDLTTIRNVPTYDTLHGQSHNTVPFRRRNHRQAGNGLYGGRGSVGVPLYATVPFPDAVPPMGRRAECHSRDPQVYFDHTTSTRACGTIEVERAAEYGGDQLCNTCAPDH
ncbi:hypothetical protein EKO04_011534 [Ascochyta lentis]|uniref:Uncharacterized protein n=1 Tax=Ascochyta lentis TaxID=205686 RepID=A0A8H7ITK4_9PLEO|nr:hypothetical protein EKO04_011534 [Ascochyta lentis]